MGDAPVINQEFLRRLVGNAMSLRRDYARGQLDPRRSVEDECGHPALSDSIATELYQQLYDREAIAARVVEVFPRECWQVQPCVYEEEESDTTTLFEEAWNALGKRLRGNSLYQDEHGSPVWEYLKRADELSGIGQFGIILLGIDDGLPLSEPVAGVGDGMTSDMPRRRKVAARNLLFLRVFPESLVQITRYEAEPTSPRFGQPLTYSVTLHDPSERHSGVGLPTATVDVHWSRVIHVADNLTSSETFGVPRMRPVLNRLLDLRKLYSGSAEMYWKGAFPGFSFETDPSAGGDIEVDVPATRDMIEQLMNGLQRYSLLNGVTAKSLAPQVVDPTPQIEAQIQAICIKLGCPKRVFCGSERGELASSQDDAAWNDRLRERQGNYLTPRLIVPFVDRLIAIGVLPEPSGYSVHWPDLQSQTASDKASVALTQTQALAAYVAGGVEAVVPPQDYLTRVIGWTDEEAEATLEQAEELALETQTAEMDQQEEMIQRGLAADPTQPKVMVAPPGSAPGKPMASKPQPAEGARA